MAPFEITTTADDGATVVRVDGEIDISNADRVTEVVGRVIQEDEPAHVRLDWSNVTFVDSSGVRALISARRRCDEHKIRFSLTTSEIVDRVLALVGLEDIGRPSDNGHGAPGRG